MKIPYTCPRCNYQCIRKGHMQQHLNKKKQCPKAQSDIELSDEIKNIILEHRVYRPPPVVTPPHQTINQIVNYNNTINNLVTNIDTIEKLTKYITFSDVKLLEYGDTIENNFVKQVKGLKRVDDTYGVYDGLILDKDNLLEVVDQVSSLAHEHCENLNIVYDKKFNKLKLYDMGKWDEFILIKGITTLLTKIQEQFFNLYECYLVRKIEFSSLCAQEKAIIRDQLIEYYKFIGCFEIDPYVKNKNDSEIIYNQDDRRCDPFLEFNDENTEMPIRYTELYTRVCGETKTSELNKIRHTIVDIIKKNCMKNVDELNKRVVDLFNMNPEFKELLLNNPAVKTTPL